MSPFTCLCFDRTNGKKKKKKRGRGPLGTLGFRPGGLPFLSVGKTGCGQAMNTIEKRKKEEERTVLSRDRVCSVE